MNCRQPNRTNDTHCPGLSGRCDPHEDGAQHNKNQGHRGQDRPYHRLGQTPAPQDTIGLWHWRHRSRGEDRYQEDEDQEDKDLRK